MQREPAARQNKRRRSESAERAGSEAKHGTRAERDGASTHRDECAADAGSQGAGAHKSASYPRRGSRWAFSRAFLLALAQAFSRPRRAMSPVLARGWQHRGRRVPAVAAWCVRPPMSSIHLRKLRRRGLVAHGTGWRGTWRGSAARRPRDRPPSSSERQRRRLHAGSTGGLRGPLTWVCLELGRALAYSSFLQPMCAVHTRPSVFFALRRTHQR